jgi:hypothetical protein
MTAAEFGVGDVRHHSALGQPVTESAEGLFDPPAVK